MRKVWIEQGLHSRLGLSAKPLSIADRYSMFSGIMNVTRRDYVCTTCGYHEEFIVEREALDKIAELAAGNIKGWQEVPVT